MSAGTSGQMQRSCAPEIIISKKEFQIWHFESFIFWSKFHFWGLLQGVLAIVFFLNFSSLANHGD